MLLQILVVILILATCLYFKWHLSHWSRRNVRGPTGGLPFFGNMLQSFLMKKHFGFIYDDIYKANPNAAYVGFYKFGTPAILVRHLELVKSVLIDNFNNFHQNDVFLDHKLDPLLAQNPFFLTGVDWKNSRNQISPLLTAVKVRSTFPLVSDVCSKLMCYIDANLNQEFEAKKLCGKFTIETVASCAFGLEAQAFADDNADFIVQSRKVFETNTLQTIRFALALFFPTIGKIMKLRFLPVTVDHWVREMLRQVLERRSLSKERRNDFLQTILDMKERRESEFNINSIAGHSLSFLTDGYETSSILMSYCLYRLAVTPHVQRRVQDEVDAVLGNGLLTDECIQKLDLLENVLYETLRLHSAVFSINRVCTTAFQLPPQCPGDQHGLTVQPGTPVIIPVYSLHHDPDIFENPTVFDPDRFTEQGKTSRQKHSFLSFGDGPRLCPGIRFGIMQNKAAIATMMSRYTVTLSPKTIEPLSVSKKTFMLTCEDGVWIKFIKRKID